MDSTPVSAEAKATRRRKNARRRLWVYAGLLAGVYAFWIWQPYEYDFIPRQIPNPNPPVDPDQKHLFAKGTRILVVTAHPDDAEFYIGGTLLQLGKTAEIYLVICTDGDKAYYGPFSDPMKNRMVRRVEAEDAMHAWHGKGVYFLAHPDGRLRANSELVGQLVDLMEKIKPDYVLAFDGAYPPRMSHQDHRRSGEAALEAAEKCQVPKWCLLFSTIAQNFALDITDDWDAKRALLAIHKSQFYGDRLKRVENMVGGTAEEEGDKAGFTLGEGFRCIRIRG